MVSPSFDKLRASGPLMVSPSFDKLRASGPLMVSGFFSSRLGQDSLHFTAPAPE